MCVCVCVCVYMCMYIYVYVCVCVYIYIHTHTHLGIDDVELNDKLSSLKNLYSMGKYIIYLEEILNKPIIIVPYDKCYNGYMHRVFWKQEEKEFASPSRFHFSIFMSKG